MVIWSMNEETILVRILLTLSFSEVMLERSLSGKVELFFKEVDYASQGFSKEEELTNRYLAEVNELYNLSDLVVEVTDYDAED